MNGLERLLYHGERKVLGRKKSPLCPAFVGFAWLKLLKTDIQCVLVVLFLTYPGN